MEKKIWLNDINSIKNYENIKYKKCPLKSYKIIINDELLSEKSKLIADKFRCLICYNIVFEPVECTNCNSLFCKTDLEEMKKR